VGVYLLLPPQNSHWGNPSPDLSDEATGQVRSGSLEASRMSLEADLKPDKSGPLDTTISGSRSRAGLVRSTGQVW
jgi:hypothetical protein